MIASLGMYDFGPAQAANDRLWALIRTGLRGRGIDAPEALTRGEHAYWDAWQSPDLILSQTCGYPFRARLQGKVTYVGTPDFGVEGCAPGYYRSVFVVRADDPRRTLAEFDGARLAYNEPLSQSGWAAPQTHAKKLGIRLPPALQTKGHRLSARAVAEELLLSPHDEGDGDSENETEYEDRPMGVDNDEVLEQYRIMAQLEAHLRVKENTGFDMAEYQEQRRTKQAAAAAEAAAAAVNNPPGCYLHSTGRLPPPILPQPRMVKEWNNTLVPQEPPLRAPTPTPRGLRSPHSGVIVPEVCDGVVVRGGEGGNSTTMAAPEGEHLVRCLGCKSTLRVPLLASLVRCPECSTISPACTRRW